MSPIVLVAMLITVVAMQLLPRRWAIVPFLCFTFLTPGGQVFYIGGIHLYALRIVILAGCVRLLRSRLSSGRPVLVGGFNGIDRVFLWLALVQAVGVVLLYRQGAAVVAQAGTLWDVLGAYFLARYLIQDRDDIRRVAKVLVAIAVVIAVCMLFEHAAVKNVFGLVFGGRIVVDIRNGHVRARGPFSQQILAGAFGGTLLPFFLWLWKGGNSKASAVLGTISAIIITLTASSSTGVSAFGFGIIALCFWPLRRRMRMVRWGIVVAILGLALTMKAPVWYLPARVDFASGSTGWDRAHLIDVFVRHVPDWWLIGARQEAYMSWLQVDYGWDLCNQYVVTCASGGLTAFMLLILLISRSYSRIGQARRRAEGDPGAEQLLWALGAVMTAHLAVFIGISYFDQSRVWWFATLAMISAVAAAPANAKVPVIAKSSPLEPDMRQAEDAGFGPVLEGKPSAGQDSPSNLGPERDYPIDFGQLRSK